MTGPTRRPSRPQADARLVRHLDRPQPAPCGRDGSFGGYVRAARQAGRLVVQPRMGMSDPHAMREGLLATRRADAATVGTITLDSYTRIGDHEAARQTVASGGALNGYPIVAYPPAVTRAVTAQIAGPDFPVQVRHGSAVPQRIMQALLAAGLSATEGGPVSYCLPYGRTPLNQSVDNWAQCCRILAARRGQGPEPHLETFGGCMMGQLCPPSLLVALSVLEALFFRQHGLRSVSLSYAQQTHPGQDAEAVSALRELAEALLPDVDWHIVVYAYMGVYPRSSDGAGLLLQEAARLAARTGAARLIVKTQAEAWRIPTVAENVAALELADRAARAQHADPAAAPIERTGLREEAQALVEAVLDLGGDVGRALIAAFARGTLDVPYCLHPDNAGRARGALDSGGRLLWSAVGAMPIRPSLARGADRMTCAGLLNSLSYVERKFDRLGLTGAGTPRRVGAAAAATAARSTRFLTPTDS